MVGRRPAVRSFEQPPQTADSRLLPKAVIDATKIIEDYRRLSCSVEKLFFYFNFFWIFFATPDRAQREQPIGGLKKFVRARVRSAWRVEV